MSSRRCGTPSHWEASRAKRWRRQYWRRISPLRLSLWNHSVESLCGIAVKSCGIEKKCHLLGTCVTTHGVSTGVCLVPLGATLCDIVTRDATRLDRLHVGLQRSMYVCLRAPVTGEAGLPNPRRFGRTRRASSHLSCMMFVMMCM